MLSFFLLMRPKASLSDCVCPSLPPASAGDALSRTGHLIRHHKWFIASHTWYRKAVASQRLSQRAKIDSTKGTQETRFVSPEIIKLKETRSQISHAFFHRGKAGWTTDSASGFKFKWQKLTLGLFRARCFIAICIGWCRSSYASKSRKFDSKPHLLPESLAPHKNTKHVSS